MKILIQCGDHFENQFRIILLARCLQRLGHEPIILLYTRGKGNIFRLEKIETIFLNDYFPSSPKTKAHEDKGDEIIWKGLRVSDFIEIEAKRRPEIAWPSKIRATTENVKKHVRALERVLQEQNPDRIVIWNGYTGYVANTLRLMSEKEGIETAYIERGLFKDSLFIDKKGVNGGSTISSISPDIFDALEISDNKNLYITKTFLDRTPHHRRESIKQKTIFFPLQVQLDTNILLYSPYRTMREAFLQIYNNLNSPNTQFVVRPHPEEDSIQKTNIPRLQNVSIQEGETLDHWISESDLVVTINSTVGLEALLQAKSVICLGKSIYSSIRTLADFGNTKIDEKQNTLEVRKYLAYLISNNLIKSDSLWNLDVVRKQLSIENGETALEIPHTINKRLISEKIHSFQSAVSISLDFSPNERLNLTYRNYSVPVDRNWIMKIAAELLPNKKLVINRDCLQTSEIKIVGEKWNGKAEDAELILDLYGNPLAINGKRIA